MSVDGVACILIMSIVWGKAYKKYVHALSAVLEECNFYFLPDGLKISSLTKCQTSAVESWIPKESFVKYEIEKQSSLGISLETLESLSRLKRKDQEVHWSWKETEEEICIQHVFQDKVQCVFHVRCMHIEADIIEIPQNTQYDMFATLTKDQIKSWLTAIHMTKSSCTFMVTEKTLQFSTKDELKSIQFMNQNIESKVNTEESFRIEISYKAFETAGHISHLNDHLQIRLKNNFPVNFTAEIPQGGFVTLHVAPIL